MTKKQAAKILKQHNLWRRDNQGVDQMPDPKELGQALEIAITELDFLCLDENLEKQTECLIQCRYCLMRS